MRTSAGDCRVVVVCQGVQGRGPQRVVGRVATQAEQHGDRSRHANFAENLDVLELPGPVGLLVAQQIQGFGNGGGLALAQAQADRLAAVPRQCVGQRSGRPASDRPAKAASKPVMSDFRCSALGARASSRAQRSRSLRVPAAANRRINRSSIVPAAILLVPERPIGEQVQNGFGIGRHLGLDGPPEQERNMNVASIFFVREERGDHRQSARAGNRFAEHASWLRTSTSGSMAARAASFADTAGETLLVSQSSRTVQSRTYRST